MLSCDGCTACCKVLKIRELEKPGNTWCQHCRIGEGCGAYETRPESCRIYECIWLQSQREARPLPPELRPDRSKVVIGTTNHGEEIVLYVDSARPEAWKGRAICTFIAELQRRRIGITVSCGEKLFRL